MQIFKLTAERYYIHKVLHGMMHTITDIALVKKTKMFLILQNN